MNPVQRAVLAAIHRVDTGATVTPFVFAKARKIQPKPYVPPLTKGERKRLRRLLRKKQPNADPCQVFHGETAAIALQRRLGGSDMKMWYRNTYLKSNHWKKLSKLAKVLADGKCQDCKCKCKHPDVHHLKYRNTFDVVVSDLVALCRGCHDERHARS